MYNLSTKEDLSQIMAKSQMTPRLSLIHKLPWMDGEKVHMYESMYIFIILPYQ